MARSSNREVAISKSGGSSADRRRDAQVHRKSACGKVTHETISRVIVVLALRCADGLVWGSDSQITEPARGLSYRRKSCTELESMRRGVVVDRAPSTTTSSRFSTPNPTPSSRPTTWDGHSKRGWCRC